MIYVYKLPEKLSNGYCFSGSVPITFGNVDWMNDPKETFIPQGELTKDDLIRDIAGKNYANDRVPLLVLDTEGPYTTLIKFNPCMICNNAGMGHLDICQACGRVELFT